jgi:hypothetical protein
MRRVHTRRTWPARTHAAGRVFVYVAAANTSATTMEHEQFSFIVAVNHHFLFLTYRCVVAACGRYTLRGL